MLSVKVVSISTPDAGATANSPPTGGELTTTATVDRPGACRAGRGAIVTAGWHSQLNLAKRFASVV